MSAPRPKRPFAGAASDPAQRQITSFFSATSSPSQSCDNDGGSGSGGHVSSPHRTSTPVLPASIQSNLLGVGMRVRKSVPEGYKTGSYGSFSLWNDKPLKQATTTIADRKAVPATASTYSAANRELLPFCGIHSIGGMSSQPAFVPDRTCVPDLDDLPGLSSSQQSLESAGPPDDTMPNTRKRLYGEEEQSHEDEGRLSLWRQQFYDGEISPRNQMPVRCERKIALPRTRRQSEAVGKNMGLIPGQENCDVVVANPDDFSEAEFLEYNSDLNMDVVYN